MGWDHGGRYYTRSRRENGRVVREYVGGGTLGRLTSQLDALEREERLDRRAVARAEREYVAALDATLADLDDLADLLARATLAASGFHRHHRGEWRKRRVHADEVD